MRALTTIIALLALLAAGLFIIGWTGWYNISAQVPHWPMTQEYIELVKDKSIHKHSESIHLPEHIKNIPVTAGAGHFQDTCRICHGGPGVKRNEFARGLYPSPPDLATGKIQGEFSNEQLLWIVENGLKMTGMPAFGATHDQQELYDIVAFLRHLPSLDANAYQQAVQGSAHHGRETSTMEQGSEAGEHQQ